MFRKLKIGLALGGGGARGFAHIGVLKILERERIPVHLITGASAGALVGAMYAQNPDIKSVETKVRNFLSSPEFTKMRIDRAVKQKEAENFFSQIVTYLKERLVINLAHSRIALIKNHRLKNSLRILLNNHKIEDARIPLGIIAADLISGGDVLFEFGSIIDAVAASVSLPGFLPPVSISDYLLIDGCITQTVPIQAAYKMGADVVIAADVSHKLEPQSEFKNIIEIMTRTNQMTSHSLNLMQLEKADLVIKPKVGQFHWSEFDHFDYIVKQGEETTEQMLPEIKKRISRKYLFMKKISSRTKSWT